MSNNIPLNTIVASRSLEILRNAMPFINGVNRNYQSDLTNGQAKANGIINIKKPPRYTGRTGELMKVESTVEQTISTQLQIAGQDVSWSLLDLQLTVDGVRNGGADEYLKPVMASIASQIEAQGTLLYRQVANSVGSTSVQPTSTLPAVLANAYITTGGSMPSLERMAVIDPFTDAYIQDSLKLQFNPTREVSEAFINGFLGRGLGFKWYDDAFIQTHTAGVYGGTPVVVSVSGNTLVTSGWSAGSILNAGDTFTLPNVYIVNPQTRQSSGRLAFFAVASTATADGSGNMTITTVSPFTASGQFQNINALPAVGAALTVTSGASGAMSKQSLFFDSNAFTFACVPTAKVPDGMGVTSTRVSDPESGLAITMTQGYDMKTNQIGTRFDILFAFLATYPELAVRFQAPAM